MGVYLSAHGYAVIGSELRYQQYDNVTPRQGNPGDDWHPYVRDFTAFEKFVDKRFPNSPMFYHGQSFGALITLVAAVEYPTPKRASKKSALDVVRPSLIMGAHAFSHRSASGSSSHPMDVPRFSYPLKIAAGFPPVFARSSTVC
jgi:alpha-beta hydrolase superfamily lysophospholipase